MDEINEFEDNLEPEEILVDPIPEKPIWGKLENCLSGCLAFILLIALPFLFFGLIDLLPDGDDPALTQKTQIEIRQEALEENWERYLDRANEAGIQIQAENFELSLCPFIEYEDWHEADDPEEVGFICGFITTPLDHDQPAGDSVQIPIAIWPSYEEGTKPDPLFITHGGPGGSALNIYPDYLYPDRIGGKRDLIFIDQRGTEYAQPNLICPEVTADIYGALNPDQETDEKYDFQEELNYCRARLAGKGISLGAFITPQITRDFAVVWDTLGYEKVNFYGVSYGSHVGQYLAAYYPDKIRSLVLDGVAPVPLDYINRSVTNSTRVFDEIISSCNQDPTCAANYPDLSRRLSALINSLDQNPIKVRLGYKYRFYPMELDGEFFFNYLFSISYMDRNYAVLPYIIKEAEENRFDYFKSWVDWRLSDISERSLAYYSVICSEHQPFTKADEISTNLDIPILSWENQHLEDLGQTCQTLGLTVSQDKLDTLPESPLPALLLSGNFDPITPPLYAEFTLEKFANGQHLVDPFGSHGVAFQDECQDSILDQFLEDPSLKVDAGCLEETDRRVEVVPASALSSLFMLSRKEILTYLLFFPALIIGLAVLRYGILGVKWVWRKIRKIKLSVSKEDRRHRWRFELSNWVFALSCFGLGYGLTKFDTDLRPIIFRYALALPEEARYLLLIPILILFIAPILVYYTIRSWKGNSGVPHRLYLLLNSILFVVTIGLIVFNDMLWVWMR